MSTTRPMSPLSPMSNVYYLAPPAPAGERPPRLARGLKLRLQLLAFWWRVRLTGAEVWGALRRFGCPEPATDAAFLEQRADIILAGTRRPIGPARVIDLAAARTRLRA
jgi:hypothetical protein